MSGLQWVSSASVRHALVATMLLSARACAHHSAPHLQMSSPQGSTSISDCKCSPGYTYVVAPVRRSCPDIFCLLPSYMPNCSCALCNRATVRAFAYAVTRHFWSMLPFNYFALWAPVWDILCRGPDGVSCTACPAGTYKSIQGSSVGF